MWSAGSSSHCCVCGLCLNTHPSSWSYIPEDAFLCRQSSAATSFIDKAFSSKTSTCGNFLHMLDEFRHIHKEAAANLHISNAPSVPLRHGTEGPFIHVTVLHCSKRPRSSFNGSVTINTPDWKLKKKKSGGGRDEAFDKRMADRGVNDIRVLKMQIRGLGLKLCMPVLFSKPLILPS